MPVTPPMHQAGRRYIKGSDGSAIFTYASYGGFTFPAAINLKMNVEPVYDSSGRIAKWWKHTFTIETVIDPTIKPENDTGGQFPVDLNMSQVRRWLSIPGQPLTFWNLGIGQNQRLDYRGLSPTGEGSETEPVPFTNPSTGQKLKQDPQQQLYSVVHSSHHSFYVDNLSDLNFGPKPQLLTCECIGGSRAYRIVWTVECALPSCCVVYNGTGFTLCQTPAHLNGFYGIDPVSTWKSKLKVTEFNYSLSWTIDEDRFTVFSIIGSIEVAGTLFNSVLDSSPTTFTGAVIDSGDAVQALRDTFLLRPGFNRSMQYDISRDKRRLDFRITDREIPSDNAYYPGIKSCSVRHSVSGNPYRAKWNIVFDGDFEVQPGVPKYTGLLALVSIISNRMANMELLESDMRAKDGGVRKYKPFYMPGVFNFDEEIFSRKVSFSFTFTGFFMFDVLLPSTKLFTKTEESWLKHREKLSPYVLDHRGSARIVTLSHEPLVTVCRNPDVFYDVTQTWFKPIPGQQYSIFTSECPEFDKAIIQVDYYIQNETYANLIGQRYAKYVGSSYNVDKTPPFYDQNSNNIGLPSPSAQEGNKIAVQGILNSQLEAKYNSQNRKGFDMTMQSLGASENYLVLKAAVQTLCHDIRSLEIRTMKVDRDGVIEDRPVKCVSSSMTRAVEDERAKVPKKTFFIENVYHLEGTPIGSAVVFINGVTAGDTVQDILTNTNPDKVDGSGGEPKTES